MSRQETRTRGHPDGGDNPSVPLCPLPRCALASLLSGPQEIIFSFLQNTGALSRGNPACWGTEGPRAGLPPSCMLLVQSAWSTRRSSPAPSRLQAGLGLPPGKRLPWQPRPKPRPPRPKACPPPAVPWRSPPTPAARPSTPALPVLQAPQTRQGIGASGGDFGCQNDNSCETLPSSPAASGHWSPGRPGPPGRAPPVQVARCTPHSCRHPHLVPATGLVGSRRVPPGRPRPPSGCPSSASCSLLPPKKRQKVALLITLLVRALSSCRALFHRQLYSLCGSVHTCRVLRECSAGFILRGCGASAPNPAAQPPLQMLFVISLLKEGGQIISSGFAKAKTNSLHTWGGGGRQQSLYSLGN